jgi:hypothetical protein
MGTLLQVVLKFIRILRKMPESGKLKISTVRSHCQESAG